MIVVGVDAGLKYHAEALVVDGVLAGACLIHSCEPIPGPETVCDPRGSWSGHRLVIERATARPQDGRTKIREVDALNRAAGRLGALHPSPLYVLPEEWKGQVSKPIDHRRTLALLSPEELALLPRKKADRGHVLDAVGIALWACGRKRLETALRTFKGGPGPREFEDIGAETDADTWHP